MDLTGQTYMTVPSTKLPGISKLVNDYFHNYNKVAEFYNGNFHDLSAFQNQIKKVKSRSLQREELITILTEQNNKYGCTERTIKNINKLLNNQTCAVVTGQQVGLFSGPLYTIYKALTAIKLSEYLSQSCNESIVPIFWLASDDHDFAEIDHIKLTNKNNQVDEIKYQSDSSNKKIPVSDIFLTSEINDCIKKLKDSTHESEFKQEIISHLKEAYQPGLSFVEAFAKWMTQIFKSYGLIFIDASHPKLKELGKKVFYKEIEEYSPSTKKAIKTSEKLKQNKYHSQIQLHDGILNLFYVEQGRQSIQTKNNDFFIKATAQTFTTNELLELVDTRSNLFSPNVMLRPVFQDILLPTIAYIGGPGEIAYFAQFKGIYENYDIPMPIIYPRKSISIIEKKIDNVLKNYNLKIQDMWQNVDKIINEITKSQIPESVEKILHNAASHIDDDFKFIKQELIALDPTLENAADLSLGRIKQQFHFLEKKILQASKRKNDIIIQQINKAKNNLYPDNKLQERTLNIVQFLIKYNFNFIDEIYEAIDIENYDHQVV